MPTAQSDSGILAHSQSMFISSMPVPGSPVATVEKDHTVHVSKICAHIAVSTNLSKFDVPRRIGARANAIFRLSCKGRRMTSWDTPWKHLDDSDVEDAQGSRRLEIVATHTHMKHASPQKQIENQMQSNRTHSLTCSSLSIEAQAQH